MHDVKMYTVPELSEAIRSGTCSVVETVEIFLEKIADKNAYYHAFRSVFAGEARIQASHLDAEIANGLWRGPLHGIPVAVKENIDICGHGATSGSLMRPANIAESDATIVARLKEAGAIIIGHTHMVEFAFGGWGTNTATGTPRNPLDHVHHRVPGGSSSGSGVAVAAGLVPLALGTDTGGSVRIPAGANGLAGFKPSSGLIPSDQLVPLCARFDVVGPMARSVGECWTLFAAMSSQTQRPIPECRRQLRIGVADLKAYGSYSTRVMKAFDQSCAQLRAKGFDLVPFSFPMKVDEVLSRTAVLIGQEAVEHFGGILEKTPEGLDRGVNYRLTDAKRFSKADATAEWLVRADYIAKMQRKMEGIDAILFPTLPVLPPRLDEIIERAMPLGDLTRIINYLDLCAMAVPAQVTEEGLRHSIQVIGKHGDDDLVFALSAEIETTLYGLEEVA